MAKSILLSRFTFPGAEPLVKKLYELENYVRTGIALEAMQAAVDVVEPAMRSASPMHTGNLKRSITGAIRDYDARVLGLVGPSYPGAPHAHMVNKGTKDRYTKGKGKYKVPAYRGRMPANKYMTTSYMASRSAATSTLINVLTTRINQATGG